MRSKSISTFVFFLLPFLLEVGSQGADQPVYWEAARLVEVKQQITNPSETLKQSLGHLRENADEALQRGPYSVTHKKEFPPSGDKHDYLSYSRYWWPNPDTKDGLPYVRHDGKTNTTMRAKGDRDSIGMLFEDIESLTLAYYFFEEEQYAKHASRLIRTWFLDAETRMNPNLNYGQAVLGRSEGRGVGIIDTRGFIIVLDSVALLHDSGHLPGSEHKALQQWFDEFLTWLRTSELGKDEADAENNHGSWYAAQVARIALFVGADDVARELVRTVQTKRIPDQFKSDGRQPHENERTKSLHYCFFNLSALSVVARVGEQLGIDIWQAGPGTEGSMKMGLYYLLPYLKDQSHWPHTQIDRFSLSPRSVQLLRWASVRYQCPEFRKATHEIRQRHRERNYALLVSSALPESNSTENKPQITITDDAKPTLEAYSLPDVSGYSTANVRKLVPTVTKGVAKVGATSNEELLEEAWRKERGKDLQSRQGTSDTQIIKISEGAVTLRELVQQINDESIAKENNAQVTLRLPILVQPGGTLIIDGSETTECRLSTDRGAFIANAGTLFVIDSKVTSWDEANKQPSVLANAKDFRPYISSYVRSKTYLAASTFAHLGYLAPTAYGLSLSSHPERERGEPSDDWPTGQIVDNVFDGLFYGFYSYEARDVAIVGNTYNDSIRYGIDPHDRSTRLIIANNVTKATRERHGIIGSRGVSDSFIFGNKTFNNKQSGIMLDRQCSGNVVVDNQVYQNGQGIAIYESSNNLIGANLVLQNEKSGMRIRNSVEVTLQNNTIVGNGDYGFEVYSKQLDDHEKRASRGDLYLPRVEASLLSNVATGNNGGCIKGNNVQALRLHGFSFEFDSNSVTRVLPEANTALDTSDDQTFGSQLKPSASTLQRVFSTDSPLVELQGD